MKGMRIAVVVIAVLLVVGLGIALMNSGGESRRPSRDRERPAQTSEQASRNTQSQPEAQRAPRVQREVVNLSSDEERTVAAPPVESPRGMDTNAEQEVFNQLGDLARQSMREGSYERAISQLRDQNKSAAKLAQFERSGPIYLNIARAQFLSGNYDRAENDLKSVLIMSSIGRTAPNPEMVDDVEMMRASIALGRGDIVKAEQQIQKTRSLRGDASEAEKAEILAHEALLADLRGNYEKADELYSEAFVKLAQARADQKNKYRLEDNIWIFEKSVETRTKKEGAEAEATKRAQETLQQAEEKAAEQM